MTEQETCDWLDNLNRISGIMLEAQREIQPVLDLCSTFEALGMPVVYDIGDCQNEFGEVD